MKENELFSTFGHQIFTNWFWLEKGEQCSHLWLLEHFHHLYHNISLSTFFKQKSRINSDTINVSKGYNWLPIYNDEKCRAGLLYIPPNSRMPMHDHKESIGIAHVLKGNPVISQAHLSENKSDSLGIFEPNQVIEHVLKPGDSNFVFPQKNNIHGFYTNHLPCLLFNIVFFQKKHQHNFYQPTGVVQAKSKNSDRLTLMKKCLSYSFIINLSLTNLAMGTCDKELLNNKSQIETSTNQLNSLIKCSKSGNTLAQFKLAMLYAAESKIKNLNDAYYWNLQAAKNGHVEAQYYVGLMLLDGIGVTQDSFEAIEWLFKSSQAGHIKASETFTYIMENPEPLEC